MANISTHTPLAGRDDLCMDMNFAELKFLLTRPSRGATRYPSRKTQTEIFLLTRPSRGATRRAPLATFGRLISTHTPLAGRDRSGKL